MAKPDEPQAKPHEAPEGESKDSELEKRNEGEGSQSGARQYREGLESFRRSGKVEEAAAEAREAIEGDERQELESAEAAGRARMAEEDPEFSAFPSWWDPDFDSTWERMKTSLSRDWEQVRERIWRSERQGDAGQRETAPPQRALSYDDAEPAIRFGHGASLHHGKQEWSDELEGNLERDWEAAERKLPWKRARPYVRHGFLLGRTSVH